MSAPVALTLPTSSKLFPAQSAVSVTALTAVYNRSSHLPPLWISSRPLPNQMRDILEENRGADTHAVVDRGIFYPQKRSHVRDTAEWPDS